MRIGHFASTYCSGCGRHRSLCFLREIPGKVGLYCSVCRKAPPKPTPALDDEPVDPIEFDSFHDDRGDID